MEVIVKFTAATTQKDLLAIHNLAPELWQYAYENILSAAQIDYMLEWMYSIKKLNENIENGTNFFLIEINGNNYGFIALTPDKENCSTVILDKLYLHKNFHGMGIGQQALNFVCTWAKEKNFTQIELHVNKQNLRGRKAYIRNGFTILRSEVNNIGNNFVMDDFIMGKKLQD